MGWMGTTRREGGTLRIALHIGIITCLFLSTIAVADQSAQSIVIRFWGNNWDSGPRWVRLSPLLLSHLGGDSVEARRRTGILQEAASDPGDAAVIALGSPRDREGDESVQIDGVFLRVVAVQPR